MPQRPFSFSLLTASSTRAPTIFTTAIRHRSILSQLQVRTMATDNQETAQPQGTTGGNEPSFSSLGIKHTNITSTPGVDLSEQQKVIVGSVLDLFAGNPTLKHFSLWQQNATFTDPITVATGYPKYTAQFYGLPALFKPITLQSYRVTSSGNPIELEMSNKYVVKGIKQEKVIDSIVRIHVGQDGKIEKVEDRWNGNLPEGAISDAFRKLNAVSVPNFVTVPKTDEEDMKMKADREKE